MVDENNAKDIRFEDAMKLLEETVRKLERGDATLEESMELFSEGMRLSRICNAKINSIEDRIRILVQEAGESIEKPFEDA